MTVEKVRRLIALTASSSTEEARTAAFLACKLIREHKLQIVEEKPSGGGVGSAGWWSPRHSNPMDDLAEFMRRASHGSQTRDWFRVQMGRGVYCDTCRVLVTAGVMVWTNTISFRCSRCYGIAQDWTKITARGTRGCNACSRPIRTGKYCWVLGLEVKCESCFEDNEEGWL